MWAVLMVEKKVLRKEYWTVGTLGDCLVVLLDNL